MIDDRRPRWASVVLLATGFSFFALGVLDCLNFTVDDTFISFRFAENWARGLGFVFNAGERVEGYSNFLWTALLGVMAKAGITQHAGELHLLVAAKLVGLLLGFATLLTLSWFILSRSKKEDEGWLTLAVAGLGSSYSFSTWALSGMETPLCAFLITLAACLQLSALRSFDDGGRASRGTILAAGICFGLASLTRPEPIVVWAVSTAALFLLSPPRLRSSLLVGAAPTVLIHLAFLAWRFGYYGQWIPNSVVAKSGGGAMYLALGVKYALAGLLGSVGFLAVGLVAVPRLWKLGFERKFLILFGGAYLTFIAASGGDWMPGFRFFVPVLALLFLLCVEGVLLAARQVGFRMTHSWALGVLLALTAAFFLDGRALVRAQFEFPTGLKQRIWVGSPERVTAAKDLRAMLPVGPSIAMGECGYVPYFNPDAKVVDLFGLMDRDIARLPGRHTYKLTAATFLAKHPDYYLMMVRENAVHAIVPAHPDGDTLMASAAFLERYQVRRAFPGFVLYERNDVTR